jgi:hypothetical protein
MAYLYSSLLTDLPVNSENQILCYYINDTDRTQILRLISGIRCHFKRSVFSEERILFTAVPKAHLEIHVSLINHRRSRQIDCQSLRISTQSEPCQIAELKSLSRGL